MQECAVRPTSPSCGRSARVVLGTTEKGSNLRPFVQRSAYSSAPGNISGVPRSPSSRTAASFRAPTAQARRSAVVLATGRGVHLGAGALERQGRARDAVGGLEPGRHLVRRGAGDRGHPLGGQLAGQQVPGRAVRVVRRPDRQVEVGCLGLRGPGAEHAVQVDGGVLVGEHVLEDVGLGHGAASRATRCWETEADIEARSRASAPLRALDRAGREGLLQGGLDRAQPGDGVRGAPRGRGSGDAALVGRLEHLQVGPVHPRQRLEPRAQAREVAPDGADRRRRRRDRVRRVLGEHGVRVGLRRAGRRRRRRRSSLVLGRPQVVDVAGGQDDQPERPAERSAAGRRHAGGHAATLPAG